MSTDFSRTLSLLRKEKGISQRAAAGDLGISQALLSHYENGIREPGLAFVRRACDYYKVSADFLLGRTLARDGAMIDAQELYDVSTQKDNALRGSIMALLNKKLLVNAVSVVYGVLGKLGDRDLITYSSEYLSGAIYTVFRGIFQSNPNNPEKFFALDSNSFSSGAVEVYMTAAKCALYTELGKMSRDKEHTDARPVLDEAALQRDYPAMYQSLLQVLHNTSANINSRLEDRASSK